MSRYSDEDIAAVYRAIRERRDMRHFRSDPIDPALLERLLEAAHLAPSVGFMQPWRFIRISDHLLKQRLHDLVEKERQLTAAALGERKSEFMRLKVEGILDCGEVLVAALMDGRERHIFGRRTLPEMDLASVACAIENLWLAARAEGIGVGWVSLFDPKALAQLLDLPPGAKPVAILCLGHVDAFYEKPMLEQENWASRQPLPSLIFENRWRHEKASAATAAAVELIMGGARSGKSRHALQTALRHTGPVTWIATAQAHDEEMRERIARHQQERPLHWETVEAPRQLSCLLKERQDSLLVVDCLTLWLSNWLCADDEAGWQTERTAFMEALGQRRQPLLLVSNEVGGGIVPENALARRFRDEAGLLHQEIAQIVPRVTWVVAGLPTRIKHENLTEISASLAWWLHPARPVQQIAQNAAQERQQTLTKPGGALGNLESLAIRLAGLQGRVCPEIHKPWISIFAADHGIAKAGVSAYPQEVTVQMVANFAAGGAAICVLARQIGASLEVVDAGVAADTSSIPGVIQAKTVSGTHNFLEQPAMLPHSLEQALYAGKAAVQRAITSGADCFIGGEMGIANTTSATALACVWLDADPIALAGPGTGLDAAGVARKAECIRQALLRHRQALTDTWQTLAALGGCEIAALTGAYIAAAQAGLPVLVDGFISTVAALAACRLNPGVRDWLLFGHQSAEPAHRRLLEALKAQPLLSLGLRLGEGSGAAAAFPVLQLACALHGQMATFAQAGVSERDSVS